MGSFSMGDKIELFNKILGLFITQTEQKEPL